MKTKWDRIVVAGECVLLERHGPNACIELRPVSRRVSSHWLVIVVDQRGDECAQWECDDLESAMRLGDLATLR